MEQRALDELYSSRISKKLASNFIELGYGLQTDCMAAEMFFNRSFEPFNPYKLINKAWFDLIEDEYATDPGVPYETDWSRFDWYHSGYEHNAWYAFPGSCGELLIRDESTFVVNAPSAEGVFIRPDARNRSGRRAMYVRNDSPVPAGLAQDGKYCTAGMTYRFSGWFWGTDGDRRLRLAVYREGFQAAPVFAEEKELTQTAGYEQLTASFTVPETGRYTFAVILEPGSGLLCDDFSLLPQDRAGAWKRSAVEAGRYVSPAVIRWPGGCFASFYRWQDGVGPQRRPDVSYFWGGMQSNDIGTDELATYAEAVGAESMICVNLFHPFKRYYEYVPEQLLNHSPLDQAIEGAYPHGWDFPEFTDIAAGARNAALWVEYCNGGADTEGGRMRIANGREQPYHVQYWEMDNEVHRWFTAEEYARACCVYADAMKAVDPTVKIGMASYCFDDEVLPVMLEIAGEKIDFLADRGFAEEELVGKLELLRAYNAKHHTNIKYCNTEWLPLNGADKYNMAPKQGDLTKSYLFSKWSYALDAASVLMMWQRYGQEIDFVNFNNLANTHAQSAIETAKEGSFVTAAGMLLHEFAHTRAAYTLRLENYHPQRNDPVQLQLSYNGDRSALILNVLNRSEEDDTVTVRLDCFAPRLPQQGRYGGRLLSADSLLSMNRLHRSEIRVTAGSCELRGDALCVKAPRLSFAEYELPLRQDGQTAR